MREQRAASNVQVGDKVHFPNSRRAAEIEQILVAQDEKGTVTLVSETSRWMMLPTFEVAVEVPDE